MENLLFNYEEMLTDALVDFDEDIIELEEMITPGGSGFGCTCSTVM